MREVGYLYVLANSAMSGLVKIGKTTRGTSERANELSRATGLPTPFIVVYEQLFEDCGAAESFVHTYLEEKGYRVADNREFFSAPVNIVIRGIALAPGAIDNESPMIEPEQEDDLFEHSEPDELDDLCLNKPVLVYPWTSIFNEAKSHYYGHDDYIQDYAEALRLFRQAAKLGALPAHGYIGNMYEDGNGVRQDTKKAFDFYKEGARKGSAYCYWAMGMLFVNEYNNQNAEKCFSLFLKNKPEILPDSQRLTDRELSSVFANCVSLLMYKIDLKEEYTSILNGFIAENKVEISNVAKNWLKTPIEDIDMHRVYRAVIQYLEAV